MRLKEIREKQGLNQRQLAEKMHIAQSLISAVEVGRLKPWPKFRKRAARALDATEDELFGGIIDEKEDE